jgi:hypothetical protein
LGLAYRHPERAAAAYPATLHCGLATSRALHDQTYDRPEDLLLAQNGGALHRMFREVRCAHHAGSEPLRRAPRRHWAQEW